MSSNHKLTNNQRQSIKKIAAVELEVGDLNALEWEALEMRDGCLRVCVSGLEAGAIPFDVNIASQTGADPLNVNISSQSGADPINTNISSQDSPVSTLLDTANVHLSQRTVEVTDLATALLSSGGASRRGILVTNNGATDPADSGVVYVMFGSTAVQGHFANAFIGMHRLVVGGSLYLNDYTGPIAAISYTGTGSNFVGVTEW